MPSEKKKKRSSKRRGWLKIVRWTVAAAVMAAVWFYGHFKGGTLFLISLPAGVLIAVFTAAALTVPVITTALVAVAFIYGIDSGWGNALRNAVVAMAAVGAVLTAWDILVRLRERNRPH